MGNVHTIHLGPDNAPVSQGRSAHGRWRVAFQQSGLEPEEGPVYPAALAITQDSDRLVFSLTDGPAAEFLNAYLIDYLWTREETEDDWPQNLRDWLSARELWPEDVPQGHTGFICGRLERNIPGGRVYLAWLGMSGVRLVDRIDRPIKLDTVLETHEGWTPKDGPEPVGMALHAYRGSLFGLDRLMVTSAGMEPLDDDLPDLGSAELQQAVEDWASESNSDLVLFDLRLNPILTEPTSVMVSYNWISPELCMLIWQPTPNATGYRLEEASTPDFADAERLAELTDGRQTQYKFSPPSSGLRYYRVVPLNQGIPGTPSDPLTLTPIRLATPLMDPILWSTNGGYHVTWTSVTQATSYEVETSSASDFEPRESHIIYRGELAEVLLSPDTPPHRYYRVRAINTLYAPNTPSAWSRPQRAPAHLDRPVFTQVTQRRIEWEAVRGARQYVVRVTPVDVPENGDLYQGEDVITVDPVCAVANQPAVYQVRAFRFPDDNRTASDWSESVTITPAKAPSVPPTANVGLFVPVLVAAALVALIVGAALGWGSLHVYQVHNATSTRTPFPQTVLDITATADLIHIQNATAVLRLDLRNQWLEVQKELAEEERDTYQTTLQAKINAEHTATHIPTATPTITLTPSITPNMTETVEMAFENGLTATAAQWTQTPTPTVTLTPSATPNLTETLDAAFSANLTATAAQWTQTPTPTVTLTPSATPNLTKTLESVFSANLTATAAQWTQTPLPSDTATGSTPRPSLEVSTALPTPDVDATVSALVSATAAQWTPTPLPTNTPPATNTPVPTETPDMTATVEAITVANLPPGCFVLSLPGEPLPVYAGPSTSYRPISAAVPRLAEVIAQWTRHAPDQDQPVETWLGVTFVEAEAVIVGWITLPDAESIYGGANCLPDVYIMPLDPTDLVTAEATGACVIQPRTRDVINIRRDPSETALILAQSTQARVVLAQQTVEDEVWFQVWLDTRGETGWIAGRVVDLLPDGCAANFAPEE